jgi:hypothetical protein
MINLKNMGIGLVEIFIINGLTYIASVIQWKILRGEQAQISSRLTVENKYNEERRCT